jgi:hypothetical protein
MMTVQMMRTTEAVNWVMTSPFLMKTALPLVFIRMPFSTMDGVEGREIEGGVAAGDDARQDRDDQKAGPV